MVAERAQHAATSENTCKLEKAPANQEKIFIILTADVQMLTTQTSKETHCKCSQHNQIHFICSTFLYWLCCEHLQRVRCKIEEVVFLICRRFFLFAARFFFWLCCEHLQRVCCQIEEVVFLICRRFFYLQRVELSRPPYKHSSKLIQFSSKTANVAKVINYETN